MSDVMRHRKEFPKPRNYPVASATVIEVGDFIYWDATNAKVLPVSSFTWKTDLALTQRSTKCLFLGVSADRSKNGDTEDIQVDAGGVKEMVCAAATWNIGDLVGIDDNAGGTALEDQKVIQVTDIELAIGRVTKQYTANTTTIEVELFPAVLGANFYEMFVEEHTITSDEDTSGEITFDTGWGVVLSAINWWVKNGSTNRKESDDFEVEKLTGDNLGKFKIKDGYSNALDASDIITVIVWKKTR